MESTRIRIRTGGQTRTPPKSKRRRRPPSIPAWTVSASLRMDRSWTVEIRTWDEGKGRPTNRFRTRIEPGRVPDQTIHVERNDPVDRGRRSPFGGNERLKCDVTGRTKGRSSGNETRRWIGFEHGKKTPVLGTGLLEPERRAV